MVDAARAKFNGIFGMVFLDGDMDIVRVVSVVEIVACNTLGVHGRVVTVRAISRGMLKGLSPQAASPSDWGVGLIEELPEIEYAEDISGGVPVLGAARKLCDLLESLDVVQPTAGFRPEKADEDDREELDKTQKGAESEEDLQLWTHERTSPQDSFENLTPKAWQQCRGAVLQQLRGVPLCMLPVPGEHHAEEALEAAAVLYAALSYASLQTRFELWANPEWSLARRLQELTEKISEIQGMARARRALAGVFGDGEGTEQGDKG
eukprot:TRINITY_DN23235_c0_g1_i3.p1 TRINITY_DN23235_c0_g1~~TRINITY_DN23235_c0_g1_i3.p1  ORF type:complete len:264 (+),score=64.12 TRINITY_DN23235_c0_g1_i3:338-1129(+)